MSRSIVAAMTAYTLSGMGSASAESSHQRAPAGRSVPCSISG